MTSKAVNFLRIISHKPAQTSFKRTYSNGLPENLRRNYEKYQRDDGVPVYLKGGIGDRLLIGVTVILLVAGLIDSARVIMYLDVKK